MYYFFLEYLGMDLPLGAFAFILGAVSVVILLFQRYKALELLSKVFAGVLVVSSLAAYLAEPAPLASLANFVQVQIPGGSWLIISSFLGLLPTGIDVSLQASEWGKAKKAGMGAIRGDLEAAGLAPRFDPFSPRREDLGVDTARLTAHQLEYCRRWFRIGIWDFRTGHVISFVIACIFLLLSAVWLYPSEVAGNAVIGEIGRVFSESLGPGMLIVFLLGAFAATFSTAFNYFDGWPRVVAACSRNLFRRTASLQGIAPGDLGPEHRRRWYSEFNIYRMTMLFSLVTATALIAGMPRPVFLVLVASALANFIAPVIFFLNLYYCFTIIPKTDRLFYPSTFATWFGWLSLIVFTGMTLLLIMDRVFDVALFGG
jgi:hypothetical protein